MKKIIASILGLTLVFSAAIAVSAAPNVTGEVNYKVNLHNPMDAVETTVNLDGKLNKKMDYKVSIKQDEELGETAIAVDEASFTYKNEMAKVQVGKFGYNPSVMDMMDTRNFDEMKAPVAVKVTPELGENIHVSFGFLPRAEGTFEAGAYQLEADYQLMPDVSVGVNYQKQAKGQDAGLALQFEAQPVQDLTIYGEYGNAVGTDGNELTIGSAYTMDKLALRGEYDFDNEAWAAKVGYSFTNNFSTEFESNSADQSQIRVNYTF